MSDEIITQAIIFVKEKYGRINLSALSRELGITRQRARTLAKNNFKSKENGNKGKSHVVTIISEYGEYINNTFLVKGITNSSVIYERIQEMGYKGSLTTVKNYINSHLNIVPAPRVLAIETPNRRRRYTTDEGEMYQMDWGFVKVEDNEGIIRRCCCFVMVCHYCGLRYVEFFTSAIRENLIIGISHAFSSMGKPKVVLTDNMKSVVIKRDEDGNPVWQKDYDLFQKDAGFETRLCKVAHPYTKGKVERLVEYVKGNFIVGRTFKNLSDINREVAEWCHRKNGLPIKESGIIPEETHKEESSLTPFVIDNKLYPYIAPKRKISFDGFINYEGHLYGVPMCYAGRTVRVCRTGENLVLSDPETLNPIYTHAVDWLREPKIAVGQWGNDYEEKPTMSVKAVIHLEENNRRSRFERFAVLTKEGEEE